MTRSIENRAKRKLERGETVSCVGGLMNSHVIDFLGQFGFDAIWIETEHGPIDFADLPDMTRVCDLWGMTSIVRVNQNNYGLIYRTLDVGALGIVVPHVDTAEAANEFVRSAKFHPVGERGMYPGRQSYGRKNFFAEQNDETLLVALIEDVRAVDNLAEIVKVDHIDVFFVAPADLGQSMGIMERNHPDVVAVERKAIEQIASAGRIAGALVSDENVDRYLDLGAKFLLNHWTHWVASSAPAYLQRLA